jgi:acyl-CoA reductase-like NAD-dependent aldehyde dehydrogenase
VHKSSHQASERELALTVGEIHGHLCELTYEKRTQPKRRPGVIEIASKPSGVCLIISGVSNLWRSAIRPLAASIAAGNVTVVAMTPNVEGQAAEIISRVWNQYLDQDCLFWLDAIQLSEVKVEGFDLVKVYGLSPGIAPTCNDSTC